MVYLLSFSSISLSISVSFESSSDVVHFVEQCYLHFKVTLHSLTFDHTFTFHMNLKFVLIIRAPSGFTGVQLFAGSDECIFFSFCKPSVSFLLLVTNFQSSAAFS